MYYEVYYYFINNKFVYLFGSTEIYFKGANVLVHNNEIIPR